MEIGSVGTAGAALQQQYAAVKTPQQEYPDQARVREEPPRASEAQTAPSENVQSSNPQPPEGAEQQRQTEAPKVFVNAQGQKTGTIISVTA